MARRYQSIMENEEAIFSMREEGRTHQEIADTLDLERDQIKRFIKRHNRRQESITEAKRRGRPRKTTLIPDELVLITNTWLCPIAKTAGRHLQLPTRCFE